MLAYKDRPWLVREVCVVCVKDFSTIEPVELPVIVPVEPVVEAHCCEQTMHEPMRVQRDDPRIQQLKPMLPELIINCWVANTMLKNFVSRAWHGFDSSIPYVEFQKLLFATLRTSDDWMYLTREPTMRQFMSSTYKIVNDMLWDSAATDRCLRTLRKIMGLKVKKGALYVIRARELDKKHDWKTVK